MQGGGRGRLGESLQSGQLVQQRGWLAQLSFQASRNCSVVFSQDPDFPVPKENTPLQVRVYRVMVQFETASQHPMWCQAQLFSSPIQSLGGEPGPGCQSGPYHFPRTGLSKLPPLSLCRLSLRSYFLHGAGTLTKGERCSCCGEWEPSSLHREREVLGTEAYEPCFSQKGKLQLHTPGFHVWACPCTADSLRTPHEGEFFLFITLPREQSSIPQGIGLY